MAPDPNSFYPGLLLILVVVIIGTASASDADAPTVYDVLAQYRLPRGLLPASVSNYTLQQNGTFSVVVDSPCYIKFDYWVYYEKEITGKIRYGSISNLTGIQVRRLLIWFDVDEIKVDLPPNDSIYFRVGVIIKKLDVNQFKTVRSCSKDLEEGAKFNEVQMLITE